MIDQIKTDLENKGFVCVGDYYNQQGRGLNFVNKKTFAYISVKNEMLDDEDFWNVLGVDVEEIKRRLQKHNDFKNPLTDNEMDSLIEDDDDLYTDVIKTILNEIKKKDLKT